MNKSHNLSGHIAALDSVTTVTRMSDTVLKTDSNRRTLMCMQFFTKSLNVKWKQTKDKDGVSTQTHTFRRASQQAEVWWLRSGVAARSQSVLDWSWVSNKSNKTWVISNNTARSPDISHAVSLMQLISFTHFIQLVERHVKYITFTLTCE